MEKVFTLGRVLPVYTDLAPVGPADAADSLEGGGFAGPVAAYDGKERPLGHPEADALENVGAVLFIAIPYFLHLQGRVLDLLRQLRLGGQGVAHFLPGGLFRKPAAALPHRQGGGGAGLARAVENAYRGGHGGEHIALLGVEELAHLFGRVVSQNPPVFHDHAAVGGVEDVLQAMLGDKHGGAQLPVDFLHGVEKVRGGNGVKLAGGLVQDQDLGLHGHDRGQVQQLLLPAGELRHIPVKPALDAEIAGHLRHTQAHGFLVAAQALQAEGQLVPDLIGNDLAVRVLHDETDFRGLLA